MSLAGGDPMKRMLALLLLVVPLTAAAQSVYRWVDEDGNVHYSQALPPEQARGAHDRLTGSGLVAESIDRVRTDEERAQLEELERQQAEETERQRLRAQQDRLFLASFPTEQDLERIAQAQRETIESEHESIKQLIEQTRSRFSTNVEQAAEYERRGEAVPAYLQQQVANARTRLLELNRQLGDLEQRLAEVEAEHAANVERHRRLRSPG